MKKKFRKRRHPFQGEMMRCLSCGAKQESDPNVESGWTLISVDQHKGHFCPNCWHTIGDHFGYDVMAELAVLIVLQVSVWGKQVGIDRASPFLKTARNTGGKHQ